MGNGKACGKCKEWQEVDLFDGICACQQCEMYGKYVQRNSAKAMTCKCYVRRVSEHEKRTAQPATASECR